MFVKYNTEPVTGKELNDIISAALLLQMVKDLDLGICSCLRKGILRELMNCRKEAQKMLRQIMLPLWLDSDSDKTDTYTEDSSIAMTSHATRTADLGLGRSLASD